MFTRARLLEMYAEEYQERTGVPITPHESKMFYDWYLSRYYEEMEVMVNDHMNAFIERELER